ncbi:pyridoxamine 5'-phosphate oxidase family protein [Microbacterium sp. SORGH_AS_0888]|uniref:pyridoxamine 5'-phosphate oxidase family protein n=1 Tax=Microbacterium sp. SORGH_AS_0888 TaxID=3041791 RepID=UPI00278928F1|nr:pyridoxamine 5'-phosphate oxidase family protein [Microbacterium sp. SORGH_AS_0888]MDQ1131266.1 pyridoxamine 5'-phosphate oxidase [Microbacterium sp. SORGH_AS_0888]
MTEPSALLPDPASPPADPATVLAAWIPQPDAPGVVMTLSTTAADGGPASRVLVLSSYDRVNLRFHTDERSAKTTEIDRMPRVAASFAWLDRGRHLVARGDAVREDEAAAAAAFARRSPELRTLAWLNDDAFAALSMARRRERWQETIHSAVPEVAPPSWIGYVLEPLELTFWQATQGAGSVRVRYRRATTDAPWTSAVLPG